MRWLAFKLSWIGSVRGRWSLTTCRTLMISWLSSLQARMISPIHCSLNSKSTNTNFCGLAQLLFHVLQTKRWSFSLLISIWATTITLWYSWTVKICRLARIELISLFTTIMEFWAQKPRYGNKFGDGRSGSGRKWVTKKTQRFILFSLLCQSRAWVLLMTRAKQTRMSS